MAKSILRGVETRENLAVQADMPCGSAVEHDDSPLAPASSTFQWNDPTQAAVNCCEMQTFLAFKHGPTQAQTYYICTLYVFAGPVQNSV